MGLCQENPLGIFLEQLDSPWVVLWASEKDPFLPLALVCQEVWHKGHCTLMWENQRIHVPEKVCLCLAVPSKRWVIYQIPQTFCDMHLVQVVVVSGSQPFLHMGPMEKMVRNQRNLVRTLVETEAGTMDQMEGEGVAAQKHPLTDMMLELLVVALQKFLLSSTAALGRSCHYWAERLDSDYHCWYHHPLIDWLSVVDAAVVAAAGVAHF